MRYFSGFCMFRDHICVVRHGGQPFQYNLGAGVDVRGQTHVPARHFSLQSAYQSAGPGHSGGQRSKCPVMWLFLIHRSCLNDITGWFMKFGAKRTTQWSGQKSSSNFGTEFPQYRPPRPNQGLFHPKIRQEDFLSFMIWREMCQNGVPGQLLLRFAQFYYNKTPLEWKNDPDWCSRWWVLADWQWNVGFTPRDIGHVPPSWQHSMVTMVTMGGDLQPGCLADRLLTGLSQPQIHP